MDASDQVHRAKIHTMTAPHALSASVEWGTVGEWAGAAGAVGAAVIALYIAIRDSRVRDRERRDLEAAQARCVVATVQHDPQPHNLADERQHLRVRIANHSSDPIMSVDILELTSVKSWMIGRKAGRVGELLADVIAPGAEAASEPVTLEGLPPIADSLPIERVVSARIQFVDARGLVWERVGTEEPTRVLSTSVPSVP
ncbi:hypothetical protein PIS_097 [Saccharomonospora phage PIS 136]|nr:hypothetical protein PIS_097 [Saccharomonospora phage PIS 136]